MFLGYLMVRNIRSLTKELLEEFVLYKKEEGLLFWKKSPPFGKSYIGKQIGAKGTHGYLAFMICGNKLLVHEAIWILEGNDLPENRYKLRLDHINRDKLDNRITNLRLVTTSQNAHNTEGPNSNNKSTGKRGIYFDKRNNKFDTYFRLNNKRYYLGGFTTLEEAVAKRLKFQNDNLVY